MNDEAIKELRLQAIRADRLREALHRLSEANIFSSYDGDYPGEQHVRAALTSVRAALALPEYEEVNYSDFLDFLQ